MTDILTVLNNSTTFDINQIKEMFQSGSMQNTPDIYVKNTGLRITMGCCSIQKNKEQMVPIEYKNLVLLCDGDIFNSNELFEKMGIKPFTQHSYEVILYLYERYGIEYTLQIIDGEYSFLLLDNNIHNDYYKLFVARDPYGKKPLYELSYMNRNDLDEREDNIVCFSTNKKILNEFYGSIEKVNDRARNISKSMTSILSRQEHHHSNHGKIIYQIKQFLPGTCTSYYMDSKIFASWKVKKENIKFYTIGFNSLMYGNSVQYSDPVIIKNIQMYLIRSIEKRCSMINEPIICMLDGSIVSSILAGLLQQYSVVNKKMNIETFSIGIENSDELLKTRKVAEYLRTVHKEIIIKKEDMVQTENPPQKDLHKKEMKDIKQVEHKTITKVISNMLRYKKDLRQKISDEINRESSLENNQQENQQKEMIASMSESLSVSDLHDLNRTKTFEVLLEANPSSDVSLNSSMHNDNTSFDIVESKKELFSLLKKIDYHHITNDSLCNYYLLGKYIQKNRTSSYLFNSVGGEQLFTGIRETGEIKDCIEYDYYVKKSIHNMHLFDVSITNVSMRYNGLESFSPFMDTSFINYYLSIPPKIRYDSECSMNKYFLRLAFSKDFYKSIDGNAFLPDDIIWTH